MPAPPFPVYRKLGDDLRWYRVEAPDRLTEVERIGRRYRKHELVASQYPERLRIAEIIAGAEGYSACSEAEFLGVLERSTIG